MSQSQRTAGTCRLFKSPQGCRFGNRCKFSHDRGGSVPHRGSSSPSSPSRSRSQTPGAPQTPRSPPSGVPRNVCQFFWTTGACNRGFECAYRHVSSGRTDIVASDEEGDEVDDFFSPEGLAVSAGSVREDLHTLNPSQVHNHLKNFIRDNYVFETAADVQGFVRVLASVNDRNKSWNAAKAQEFLEVIVTGNALHRISEVLRFEPVDTSIGFHTGALSFQRGYFPIFQFFSSDLILKSTLHKNINLLYAMILNNHDIVFATLRSGLADIMNVKSWKDPTPNLLASMQNNLDGVTCFRTLTTVLLQYSNRYKDAIRSHPEISDFVREFADWFETWAGDVSASIPRFEDPIVSAQPNNRRLTIDHIRQDVDRIVAIVQRETGVVLRLRKGPAISTLTAEQRQRARVAQFAQTYDPPGELRELGPRHDNDFQDISNIRIAPTHMELLSPVAPYLPVFSRDAPHHLPEGSMERHLDIQFRLLREELISATRVSLNVINEDLVTMWSTSHRKKKEKTKLETLLDKNGGAYRTDSVFFQVYTNVEFIAGPPEAQRRGITVALVLDAPPGGAAHDKDAKKRFAFWEHSKRLQGASLVALIVVSNRNLHTYLGMISSYGKDVAESAKLKQGRIQVRVSFFDSKVELMALRGEQLCIDKSSTFAILVDNSVMFESVRPFLHKLQTIEPTEIPFSQYIAPGTSLKDVQIMPPKYSLAPGFKFSLQCLAKEGAVIADLDMSRPLSIGRAREQLKKLSILDPSQAEAVVDTLTREVSLIQGPPGTGKSYTAKEILRVLFASKIRPIVLIAYTNHALDHMVTSVLDAKITEKVVRLGTRSSDERIAEYTLDKLERRDSASTLDRSIKRKYAAMKDLEERITQTMTSIRLPQLTWPDIEDYLDIYHPAHADLLRTPPFWITDLANLVWSEQEQEGEFEKVERKKGKKKANTEKTVSRTLYGFWREGVDLAFIQQSPPQLASNAKGKAAESSSQQSLLTNPPAFFEALGFGGQIPPVPSKNRPLEVLLRFSGVWSMSSVERRKLAIEWETRIRALAYESNLDSYNRMKEDYKEVCKEYDDMRDEVRRRLLSQSDLIACTTTGAASLTSLLGSIAPKVLMVEEAGQVLEAHVLTSLVSSVHHLICIGDPKQLRPSLATFALSMDSGIGNDLYKFDRSLMERLSDFGFPMSQINVQRRMRPTISHFIRTILYPKLEDNEIVLQYPPVQGMRKDVFFFNHLNKENGTEDSVSKFNTFEVDMIKDLVLYFLRQGSYNGQGDIAVLCAYLGQLQKVRAALRDLKIAVAVDERDAEQLARQGIEEEVEFEEVLVTKHVRLGTVDIFQGQEAKIVIVSLVRNSGHVDTGSGSIGFLKSSNRVNVALSRAKHGLYVFGNAANLRQNATWSTILDEMESRDQIGPAFEIVCPRHPDQASLVSKPGELPVRSPAGGCLLPCEARLICGHICPSACHAALDNHRNTKCMERCNRTPCPRKHPCSKRCSEDCGDCTFPMYDIRLPCGHMADKVPCYLLENLQLLNCNKRVKKQLPGCEHSATMACHQDSSKVQCLQPCSGTLQCCTKMCKASCSQCQSLTIQRSEQPPVGKVLRTHHVGHPCERMLYCQHKCGLDCSQDHHCNTACRGPCRQRCSHHKCPNPCSEPCAPCMQPCAWSCAHHSCPVLCGSICSRLPCDEPCSNVLKCGHPCPSVCGEPCADQKCIVCLPHEKKSDIVDFIMQRRLEEVDLESTDVSDRLITLACGHIFTVETLDGHCNMSSYYNIDEMGRFLSTKAPPVNYQTPPTCPTCRGPITALRYGRVTKRATLDILEQNVASTMSIALDECSPSISEFATSLSDYQKQAEALQIEVTSERAKPSSQKQEGNFTQNGPLPSTSLEMQSMQQVHGLTLDEASAWHKIVKGILATYRRVVKVANTRGAHVKAYEAAVATLFRLEMDAIASDPMSATDAPEPQALLIVDQKIGQAPPKADVRFQIEAYFMSLELRSLIAQIAQGRIEGLSVTDEDEDAVHHRGLWTSFVTFLYDSCIADTQKAVNLAKNCSASRQEARASVHKLRFEFELFRWKIMSERSRLLGAGLLKQSERDELCRKVRNYKYLLLQSYNHIQKEYLRQRPYRTTDDLKEERNWLAENCGHKVELWERECDSLETYVKKDSFYQPISLQEREEIVKAFGFSHRGHFYNCENGHTFVIGECGGAMETSRCPECNAPVGGSSHRLNSSNTRAMEYEAIARRQGSLDPHWNWARGA